MIKFVFLIFTFIYTYAVEPISPIPQEVDYNMKKALLGKKLFSDTILSKDRTVSCASCHDIENGGADTRTISLGVNGKKGKIQSPTVLNAKYNFVQFWNGRAENLEKQAHGSLTDPLEHNMDPKEIEKRLNDSEFYKEQFQKVYEKSEIKYNMVLETISEFEKALTTPNAKFDRYLRGEIELSQNEKSGYELFKKYGCITCHNGVNLGGNSYQKMGIFIEYGFDDMYPDRHKVTKKEIDKNVYKVPTLRNISKTAPYFHDGSAHTLKDAVIMMSLHNLGIIIKEQDADNIVDFLNTLDGDKPAILDSM